MTTSNARLLEQQRAQAAHAMVLQVKENPSDKAKEHSSLARSAPVDVMQSFGQTLAFWKAKKEAHHIWLYDGVSKWVMAQLGQNSAKDLLDWIMDNASGNEYRLARNEALAYLHWVKRFAEAELPRSDS